MKGEERGALHKPMASGLAGQQPKSSARSWEGVDRINGEMACEPDYLIRLMVLQESMTLREQWNQTMIPVVFDSQVG